MTKLKECTHLIMVQLISVKAAQYEKEQFQQPPSTHKSRQEVHTGRT